MASDIFDAYAKLAIEKGIIKIAQEKESKELKKYKNDSYPRAGSDTLEIIENKYNVKPEKPKSQEYKNNIMEVAHPNKVILSPAYDKINALVENNIERQNIIINITQKPVNGQLTQHKYAQDLASSLVAIANDLDNKNIEPLRKLADECIEDLHKKAFEWSDIGDWLKDKVHDVTDIGSGAVGGSTIGAIAGGLIGAFGGPLGVEVGIGAGALVGAKAGGIIGGLLSAIMNTAPQAKSVAINAKIAKTALETLIEDHKSDIFLTSLDTALTRVMDTSAAYGQIVDQMHLKSDDPQAKQSAHTIAVAYQTQLQELDRLIDIFLENAKMGRYAPEEGQAWSKIKTPFTSIFGDHAQDAIKAFQTLEEVNGIALKGIASTQQEAVAAKQAPVIAPPPSAPAAPATPPKGSAEWFDMMTKSLEPFLGK